MYECHRPQQRGLETGVFKNYICNVQKSRRQSYFETQYQNTSRQPSIAGHLTFDITINEFLHQRTRFSLNNVKVSLNICTIQFLFVPLLQIK